MGHLDNIGFINGVLTQQQETILSVEFDTLYFDPDSKTLPNYLTANVSWAIYPPPTWVTVTPNSGSGSANLNITVEENSGGDRIGSVTISGGGKTVTITVIQYGPIIP